jgi:putative membrane protein
MNDASPYRRPAAFRVNDPQVTVAPADAAANDLVAADARAMLPVPPAELAIQRMSRGFRWGKLFWSSLGGLAALALGLSVTSLVEGLFARSEPLGWFGLALGVVCALALLMVVARETLGLLRLSEIEGLRTRAAATVLSDDRREGRAIVGELLSLTRASPHLARARLTLERNTSEIIDGADLVRLAERELMSSLDREARQLVSDAAKRVSIITAISPRASIDMIFVLATALRLLRRLAYLYGGRPGTLGLIRLTRMVASHLALTGGIAAGDSIVQQMVGHGVAAKLSTRLGEGVLNGLLTARVGLAAIEVTRPLPFVALPQPTLRDLGSDLLRANEDRATA